MSHVQAPNTVVMIRPHHFTPNPQTADDNAFQLDTMSLLDTKMASKKAFEEVTTMSDKLKALGINVLLFEDKSRLTPDSVFPNNWFSTHEDGTIFLYPMYAKNRRLERRSDIIEHLANNFSVNKVIDLSGWENKQHYLEGTGALVIDHQTKFAYVTNSKRANIAPLRDFCEQQGITPVMFSARDKNGIDIYHTNVLMCVTTDFVIICDNLICDIDERAKVLSAIAKSGKTLVALDEQQINHFAGNMFELTGKNGRFIAMSTTAFDALTTSQKQLISEKVTIEVFSIPTIELAGGSVRCMLAGIHLPQ